jgi:hypothetical protein
MGLADLPEDTGTRQHDAWRYIREAARGINVLLHAAKP